MITYSTDVSGLTEQDLRGGFFAGWPTPPTAAQHLAVLRGSYRVVLATDGGTGRIAGFVNMISDGVLTGFVPWLEVLPAHRGAGVGGELVRRLLASAGHLYSVDLTCDDHLRPYYERLGMRALTGMGVRNGRVLGAGAGPASGGAGS